MVAGVASGVGEEEEGSGEVVEGLEAVGEGSGGEVASGGEAGAEVQLFTMFVAPSVLGDEVLIVTFLCCGV